MATTVPSLVSIKNMVHKDIQWTTSEKKTSSLTLTCENIWPINKRKRLYLPALHGAVIVPKRVSFKQRGDRKLSGQHMGRRSTTGIIHYLHMYYATFGNHQAKRFLDITWITLRLRSAVWPWHLTRIYFNCMTWKSIVKIYSLGET